MVSKSLTVERNVAVKMRDGVTLYADVYRPQASGPLPVLLQRTPYGKQLAQTSFALMAAERGYAVVIQDTRGRWASEGEHYPMRHEMADGYDTVEWAAVQPWSDGQVGMFGLSYMGYTQLAAAACQPSALKTIIPNVTFCDPRSVFYQNGALALGVGVSWGLMAGATMAILRHPGSDEEKQRLMDELIAAADGMVGGETFAHRPLRSLPLLGEEGVVRFVYDAISHSPSDAAYWQPMVCPPDRIKVPALHIGGWYDIFVRSTVQDFVAIQKQGHPQQKLLIGPWVHGAYDNYVGEVDFGVQSSGLYVVPDEIHLRWFDYWLKGVENGIMEERPIRIFVMGDNRWRDEDEWPLARTRYTPYYLHSGGTANSRYGDGILTQERPGEEPVDSFVYDPRNPVPTRGGNLCCYRAALPPGAYDQRPVEERPDVLVYTSPPLPHDLEVTGPVEVHLWATTTAPDTDFTAKLVDVAPCGYARNVQDGIVRTSSRAPGAVHEYTIDLGPTSNVFKAGHCIRLEIASSNFPRFSRNPNTGQLAGEATELRTALQTVLHNASSPSHVLLPVIPR